MTTCERSQLTLFDETALPSTSSAAGFHAKTSRSLADELASRVRDLVSGRSSRDSLANYDLESCSWRTSQACIITGWATFSATWPRSGSIVGGIAYQLQPLAPRTDASAYGSSQSIPTPTAGDHKGAGSRNTATSNAKPGLSLTDWARQDGGTGRLLPTPSAGDHRSGAGYDHDETRAKRIARKGDRKKRAPQLRHISGGRLNPRFVEQLMGYPTGWTELEP